MAKNVRTLSTEPLRQTHNAGEYLFVGYANETVPIIDLSTGEIRPANIFIAILGASNYTYVEATFTQQTEDWIWSNIRAFDFLGGVPQFIVPDNPGGTDEEERLQKLLSNPIYQELLVHYGTTTFPTSKEVYGEIKAEFGAQAVERWLVRRLQQQSFFTLAELNYGIRHWLKVFNDHPFRKLTGSRRSQYGKLDRPALRTLPTEVFVAPEWRKARVHIDSHIEIDGHYYSVPHALIRHELDIHLTRTSVECLYQGKQVAMHKRSNRKGKHTTDSGHLPKSSPAPMEWSPGRFLNWALEIGPHTRDLVRHLLFNRPSPELGFRSCLGLLSLSKRYGKQRLEAACKQAIGLGLPTRRSVVSILEKGLEDQPLSENTLKQSALPQ